MPASWLRRVWERMAAVYGHRWVSPMGDMPQDDDGKLTTAGDTWARGLTGLGAEQLGRGLEACIVSADGWPPTLPEFRAMCFGIPSLATVRADLTHSDAERHPFTVMVYRRLDGYAYRRADLRDADRMLREAYTDAREAVLRGEPMPEPLARIEHAAPATKPADPAVAAAAIVEIGRLLKPAAEITDAG